MDLGAVRGLRHYCRRGARVVYMGVGIVVDVHLEDNMDWQRAQEGMSGMRKSLVI